MRVLTFPANVAIFEKRCILYPRFPARGASRPHVAAWIIVSSVLFTFRAAFVSPISALEGIMNYDGYENERNDRHCP